jgi:hypothetical protein
MSASEAVATQPAASFRDVYFIISRLSPLSLTLLIFSFSDDYAIFQPPLADS